MNYLKKKSSAKVKQICSPLCLFDSLNQLLKQNVCYEKTSSLTQFSCRFSSWNS
jgi:hypothetical protein